MSTLVGNPEDRFSRDKAHFWEVGMVMNADMSQFVQLILIRPVWRSAIKKNMQKIDSEELNVTKCIFHLLANYNKS